MRRIIRPHVLLLLAMACFASGCLMPSQGTPVWVDSRSGRYWNGKGKLLEVSPDQKRCRIAARDVALIVRERWVDCTAVHNRPRH